MNAEPLPRPPPSRREDGTTSEDAYNPLLTPASDELSDRGSSTAGEDGASRRRSLKEQVTSTISSSFHYLASEVSSLGVAGKFARPPGITSGESSLTSEPPLTRARPPASLEELEEQLDKILYAIDQLQQLQERRRYIASNEVKNLRSAFLFAVGEEQRHREEARRRAESGASTPTPRTSALQRGDTQVDRSSEGSGGDNRKMGISATASSPPAVPTDGKSPYSPKAAAADRLLTALEHYVDQTPTSTSFDVTGARFSWRSVLHTPGERRLQSLVVSMFIFFTGIPICVTVTVLLLMWRYTAPFVVLYCVWIFTFGRPRHPLYKNPNFTRFFLWRYYRDYFPTRLIIPRPVRRRFDKERNYFFVYHPHGIHTFGALINFGLDTNDVSKMLEGITIHIQTLSVNLYVPLWRQLTVWMGAGDASASCIRKTLQSGPGQSVMLVVGGAEESRMAKPNSNDLLLFKRKGFIKIALQEGTPLVPVYGFGENNVYGVADLAGAPWVQYGIELWKRYAGFAIPLIRGRGFFNFHYGILPHRRPIVVVVGEPLEVPHIAQPTKEDLEFWQRKYIDRLQQLYNAHRGIYDLESTGLRIMQ